MDFDIATYYPVFIYLFVVLGFAVTNLILTHVINPRKRTRVKDMPYESGMDPVGDARQRFDVKFYLIAIMFLVFDVELLFLYPWAVIAYPTEAPGVETLIPPEMVNIVFWSVLVFIALVVVAYLYDWRKGVFQWR